MGCIDSAGHEQSIQNSLRTVKVINRLFYSEVSQKGSNLFEDSRLGCAAVPHWS
ncbi:hypothetical protein GLOTRDRAFT_111316 [Gloeophyllum trabeum ATCC 11539]|uniref:Uncharacterized protein n=1 Tax=Gloeophyllum trabeum (strain ATCC 11539 / FP-39264 / Madison 617) TaxID=670483 RepID=S7Q4V3_GLOTA|nr:uncharacterized protein GLOTRDRAFT_111316 [Gloeophyllum trabeum ATCC 11539]EPQ54548.1 hypothetical protein GLOTRDRAFT_111316 [Gloeophyllum trabeum ATCC 11539]